MLTSKPKASGSDDASFPAPLKIIKRKHARAVGQKWYFTGIPCRYGHLSKRNVASGGCRACANLRAMEWSKRTAGGSLFKEERKRKREQSKLERDKNVELVKSMVLQSTNRNELIHNLLKQGISQKTIAKAISLSHQRISQLAATKIKKKTWKYRPNITNPLTSMDDASKCCWVYAIRLPVNDYAVAYVGFTSNPIIRFQGHCRSVLPIGLAIRACGHESVIFELLENGPKDAMLIRERELIEAYKTFWPLGYNDARLAFSPNLAHRARAKLAV